MRCTAFQKQLSGPRSLTGDSPNLQQGRIIAGTVVIAPTSDDDKGIQGAFRVKCALFKDGTQIAEHEGANVAIPPPGSGPAVGDNADLAGRYTVIPAGGGTVGCGAIETYDVTLPGPGRVVFTPVDREPIETTLARSAGAPPPEACATGTTSPSGSRRPLVSRVGTLERLRHRRDHHRRAFFRQRPLELRREVLGGARPVPRRRPCPRRARRSRGRGGTGRACRAPSGPGSAGADAGQLHVEDGVGAVVEDHRRHVEAARGPGSTAPGSCTSPLPSASRHRPCGRGRRRRRRWRAGSPWPIAPPVSCSQSCGAQPGRRRRPEPPTVLASSDTIAPSGSSAPTACATVSPVSAPVGRSGGATASDAGAWSAATRSARWASASAASFAPGRRARGPRSRRGRGRSACRDRRRTTPATWRRPARGGGAPPSCMRGELREVAEPVDAGEARTSLGARPGTSR